VLLALAEGGATREDAYRLVQKNAMATWEQGGSFKERLLNDPEVMAGLGPGAKETLEGLFDPKSHLKSVDYIFKQVLGE
jgi:adenylosuccinate lyase